MHTLREAHSLGCAGLAEGTNANTFKTSNILHYSINGRTYVKAATDNVAFSAGHNALAAGQKCAFFVFIDSAGNLTTVQSAIVPNTESTSYRGGAWEWPQVIDKACIGAIVVDATVAAVFVPNTTDLGAANVVDTYHNVGLNLGAPVTY
jgi:hypothetical protein